ETADDARGCDTVKGLGRGVRPSPISTGCVGVRAGRQSRSARTRGGGRRRTRGGRSEEDPTKLILLNGPPGIGKSPLANRFAGDHPLTLVLDIDSIRTSMGAWETHDDSKRLARLA